MDMPFDLAKYVSSYLVKPKMKLLDWVQIEQLNWNNLSKNPNGIQLLESNLKNKLAMFIIKS